MKKIFAIMLLAVAGFFGAKAADVPSFPGGESALSQYLKENVKYPSIAKEMGVEGVVTVGFIVQPDGSLTAIKVIRMVDPDLEKEAVRVVTAMPAWVPAEKDGTPVEAPSQVEVSFIIEE